MRVIRIKRTKQKNESAIKKVITLTPALKILPLFYVSITHDKTHIFTSVCNGARACVRLYVIRDESFGGVSMMSKIHVYVTVWRGG